MAIAAVPGYLQSALKSATDIPPGHRFNLYFPIWEEQTFDLKDKGKSDGLGALTSKNTFCATLTDQLRLRQKQSLQNDGSCLVLEAKSVAPFATGLGLEHPLENGFAFLNPYGVAYLPGSSVKGVLRQAARNLIEAETSNWSDEQIYGLGTLPLSMLDVLFGLEAGDESKDHFRGVLTFYDVIPQLKDDKMGIEIMTPHQSHYLQGSEHPHDSGQPNPIKFLVVPAESTFDFLITCDLIRLNKIAKPMLGTWSDSVTELLEFAFDWLGFGAKTAVGYGAMRPDQEKMRKRELARENERAELVKLEAQKDRNRELALMSPATAMAEKFFDNRQDKNQKKWACLLKGLKDGKFDGEHKASVADLVRHLMIEEKKWKEKSQAKKPEKDDDFQDTLKIMNWIGSKS